MLPSEEEGRRKEYRGGRRQGRKGRWGLERKRRDENVEKGTDKDITGKYETLLSDCIKRTVRFVPDYRKIYQVLNVPFITELQDFRSNT